MLFSATTGTIILKSDTQNRTYKVNLFNANQWVNGRLESVNFNMHNAMFYPNSYLNFNVDGHYTKHYYNGMERIASRLGDQHLPIHTHDPELQDRKEWQDSLIRKNVVEITGYEFLPVGEEQNPEDPKPVFELPQVGITSLQPISSGSVYYYHPNHLGSTCYVTDQNQTIVQGFLYAPFGEITNEYNSGWQSGVLPKYSFNAKEMDEETGMYYYEARYYKPPVFTSRDAMMDQKPWLSPYHYCSNNPVGRVDPSGMDDYEISIVNNNAQINVVRTNDKTNSYNYINSDGTSTDLGTYEKTNNLIKLPEKTDFFEQVKYSQGKNYIDGDVAAGFLAAMYSYYNETGNKVEITQLNNSKGGHSSHTGKGTNADVKYANLNGFKPNEAVWTNGNNFDKQNSQKLVDYFMKFGFNRPNGKFSILTENAKGNGPALKNTDFVDGKGKYHHKHHIHLQQFNNSIINVISK